MAPRAGNPARTQASAASAPNNTNGALVQHCRADVASGATRTSAPPAAASRSRSSSSPGSPVTTSGCRASPVDTAGGVYRTGTQSLPVSSRRGGTVRCGGQSSVARPPPSRHRPRSVDKRPACGRNRCSSDDLVSRCPAGAKIYCGRAGAVVEQLPLRREVKGAVAVQLPSGPARRRQKSDDPRPGGDGGRPWVGSGGVEPIPLSGYGGVQPPRACFNARYETSRTLSTWLDKVWRERANHALHSMPDTISCVERGRVQHAH